MLGYLKKFNSLPAELRQKVSGKRAMAAIEMLEKKYQLPLAVLVMKVMAREVALKDLVSYLLRENLDEASAGALAGELKEKIFFSVRDYLSSGNEPKRNLAFSTSRPGEIPTMEISPVKPADITVRQNGEPLVKGASFFFSADDEAEIRELTKKAALAEKAKLPASAIEEKLDIIIDRAQINFGSVDLADRFRQILKTYLRGIRNKLETMSTLVKPFLSGGLSFDEDSAQKVMDLADKILKSEPGEAIKLLPKIKIPELDRDVPYDFSKLTAGKKISLTGSASLGSLVTQTKLDPGQRQGIIKEDLSHELAPLTPAVISQAKGKVYADAPKEKFFRPIPQNNVKSAPSAQAAPAREMPFVRLRPQAGNLSTSQKVKVEDVKYIPKVMAPLDEIKYLDLVNFRRLDKNPTAAAEKIKTKINLLAEEGYGKRLEGIKLWRICPVSKLYLEIGHLSISGNKPVNVIIEERKKSGYDYLTAEEFEAIMDLNKSLRF